MMISNGKMNIFTTNIRICSEEYFISFPNFLRFKFKPLHFYYNFDYKVLFRSQLTFYTDVNRLHLSVSATFLDKQKPEDNSMFYSEILGNRIESL